MARAAACSLPLLLARDSRQPAGGELMVARVVPPAPCPARTWDEGWRVRALRWSLAGASAAASRRAEPLSSPLFVWTRFRVVGGTHSTHQPLRILLRAPFGSPLNMNSRADGTLRRKVHYVNLHGRCPETFGGGMNEFRMSRGYIYVHSDCDMVYVCMYVCINHVSHYAFHK